MHVLIILILATAGCHHNIAGADGMCDSSPPIENTMPVTSIHPVNVWIRINCTEGFVRAAGTSNIFRCMEENGKPTWTQASLPLKCKPDPKKRIITTDPPKPGQKFTTSTERARTSRIPRTSMPSAATSYGATNEIATYETRTTTTRTTLKTTTKETELITTTNEVPSSVSTKCTNRQNMTAKPSPTQSKSLTTTTGVNSTSKTTTSKTLRDSHNEGTFSHNKSTIGGTVGVVVILCLTAAVFLLWWRSRRRATNATNDIEIRPSNDAICTYYIPVPVSDSEHCLAKENIADASDRLQMNP